MIMALCDLQSLTRDKIVLFFELKLHIKLNLIT